MLQHIIALATGLGIGFIISFPVGPVGFLAIERTLDRGFGAGVRSGVGALFADGLYAGMIAFFARFVRRFFFAYSTVFQVVSIVLLFVIGINMIRTRLSPDVGVETATNKLEEFFSTFFLSLLLHFFFENKYVDFMLTNSITNIKQFPTPKPV